MAAPTPKRTAPDVGRTLQVILFAVVFCLAALIPGAAPTQYLTTGTDDEIYGYDQDYGDGLLQDIAPCPPEGGSCCCSDAGVVSLHDPVTEFFLCTGILASEAVILVASECINSSLEGSEFPTVRIGGGCQGCSEPIVAKVIDRGYSRAVGPPDVAVQADGGDLISDDSILAVLLLDRLVTSVPPMPISCSVTYSSLAAHGNPRYQLAAWFPRPKGDPDEEPGAVWLAKQDLLAGPCPKQNNGTGEDPDDPSSSNAECADVEFPMRPCVSGTGGAVTSNGIVVGMVFASPCDPNHRDVASMHRFIRLGVLRDQIAALAEQAPERLLSRTTWNPAQASTEVLPQEDSGSAGEELQNGGEGDEAGVSSQFSIYASYWLGR